MQRSPWHRPILCAAAALSAIAGLSARGQEQEPRFHARLADGTYLLGAPIRDWHDANATPRIGNQALFDPGKPVDWLVRDTPPVEALPAAWVEFVGGDRLPGEVIDSSSGAETPFRRLPPHLIVRPVAAYRRPNTEIDPPLRIESAFVRRIVWSPGVGGPVEPDTALLRDGGQIRFRVLRWTGAGVALLTESGVRNVSFGELAEVVLRSADPWSAYLSDVATVLPGGNGRLIQIETDDGLVALCSSERLRAETQGDNRRTDHWYQAIQPAWSLDPFWVRFSSIRSWRFFPPERVPLTLLDPRVTRQGVAFSASRPPLVNRAVTGAPLSDGKTLFGWGFGTNAPCELSVELPEGDVAVRAAFALDPASGRGGCARARIESRVDDEIQRLFESELLIGAAPAQNTGRVGVPATSAEPRSRRELVLVSDPVYDALPNGADPFDVRDALNWLAPEIELDPESVQASLRRLAPARLPGLEGWQVDPATAELAAVVTRWDTRDWEDPRFRSFVSVDEGYLAFSRRLRVEAADRFLAVYAHCPHDEFRPARVQVRINGVVAGEQIVPQEHGRREPDPLLFPVHDFAGQTITAEIVQLPGAIDESKPAAVDWRGAELVAHRPSLKKLFEDEPAFAKALLEGEASVALENAGAHTGSVSLKIDQPGRRNPRVAGWEYAITEEPDLGEYRFVRFAWKGSGRGPITLGLAHEGDVGPGAGVVHPPRQIRRRPARSDDRGPRNGYRYLAGPGGDDDPAFTPSIRIDGATPLEWRVVERDLFSDFGPLTLTGLDLASADGSLVFDGLYLARSSDQFRFIEEDLAGTPRPRTGEGGTLLSAGDPRAFASLVTAVAPGFGLSGQAGELQLLRDYRERDNVLRTYPEGRETRQSARLTAALKLPAEGRPRLMFAVAEHGTSDKDQRDWDLQVFANGKELLSRRIDRGATSGGWLDLDVDLADFSGRPVRLELRHKATGWDHEAAYWHNVRIVTQ